MQTQPLDEQQTQPLALQAYCFPVTGDAVRVTMEGREPWFFAKDVCQVLGLTNSRVALRALDDDEKGVSISYTLGGNQSLSTISESGLYALIMRSRKPQAKAFRKWVTGEVLPSIRRTGRYEFVPEPVIESPETVIHRVMAGVLDGTVSTEQAKVVCRLYRVRNDHARARGSQPAVPTPTITPNHPWVRAIAALVASAPWEGSATDLSAVLARQGIDADARKLGRFLSQARPVFQSIGITVGDKIQVRCEYGKPYLRKISMEHPILPS